MSTGSKKPLADANALVDRARAEGRHADAFTRICGGCRAVVACGPGLLGIMHVTLDGVALCLACAVRAGACDAQGRKPQAAKGA
jgi:hypothetical protein